MVEPSHPFERRDLEGLSALPGCSAMDQFGLIQPVNGLGQRVVVAVAAAADRRLDPRLGESFGVPTRDVLGPAAE